MMLQIKRKKLVGILIPAATLAAFFMLVLWSGSGTICLFRTYTGMPCPGCGLTHAFLALINGDVVASLRFHPLLVSIPFIGAVIVFGKIGIVKFVFENKWFWLAIIALFAGVYIFRMIMFFPNGEYSMCWLKNCLIGSAGMLGWQW